MKSCYVCGTKASAVICHDCVKRKEDENARLRAQLASAKNAWQVPEDRIVRLCEILGVEYTLEEPETLEQAAERIVKQLAEAEAKAEKYKGMWEG